MQYVLSYRLTHIHEDRKQTKDGLKFQRQESLEGLNGQAQMNILETKPKIARFQPEKMREKRAMWRGVPTFQDRVSGIGR